MMSLLSSNQQCQITVGLIFVLQYTPRLKDGTETVQVTPLRRTLASSPNFECASCHHQAHTDSRTLLQQNPPVCNSGCWLMQIVLYNGHEMVVVVVVVVVVLVVVVVVVYG